MSLSLEAERMRREDFSKVRTRTEAGNIEVKPK
jgi:hypothetical protein